MPCSTTKTQHSQINLILFFFLKNEYYQGWERGMGGGFCDGYKVSVFQDELWKWMVLMVAQ